MTSLLDTLIHLKNHNQLPPVQLWKGDIHALQEQADFFINVLLETKDKTTHPNFFELKPLDDKKEITIEPTRSLLHFLKTTATLPIYRTVLVRDATLLNRQATNALLKILEAPPKNTVIILLCESPGKLLPTLLSRCLRFNFEATQAIAIETTISQALGRLLLTMMSKGTSLTQPLIDDLEDAQIPPLLESLLPFLFKITSALKAQETVSPGIAQLLKLTPHHQWVNAYLAVSDYLDAAIPAHLPQREILRGALYLIHDPRLAYGIKLDQL